MFLSGNQCADGALRTGRCGKIQYILPSIFHIFASVKETTLLAAHFYLRFEKDTLKRMLCPMVKEIRKRKGAFSMRTQNSDFYWKTFRIHNPLV